MCHRPQTTPHADLSFANIYVRPLGPPAILPQTNQDALDTNNRAAADAGGRALPGIPGEPRGPDDDVVLAARHCVALDGSRHFPADRGLGLFEMGGARAGTPQVTAASVELVPQQRREKGGTAVDHTGAAGAVGVSLLLEVDITDERTAEKGDEAPSLGLHAAYSVGESIPTREEVETAAAQAAAVGNNAVEAQLAISALAAWNLVSNNGVAKEGTAAAIDIRIEVAAAFGCRGDRYTSSKSLSLRQDDGYIGGNVVPLSASFDWQPTGDVWASLDGPAVADVKVYGAPSGAMAGSTSTKQGEVLLLQSTLCKRASPGMVKGTAKRAAAAPMKAILGPYIEQTEYAKLAEEGGAVAASAGDAHSSSRPLVVVSEIEDEEWWKGREAAEYGRGMDAVNALPRIPGWKPGDWKKRRRRRRRQEEEKERQRAEKAGHRRAGRRGGEGDSSTGSRGGSKRRERRSGWGVVKGAWRAVGRMLRGATGKLRRKK